MSLLDTRPPAGGKRRAAWIVAATAALALAAGVVFFSLARDPESSAPAPSPEAATTQPSSTGSLRITANTPAATVWLNSDRLGLAPQLARDLQPGPHNVRVERFGYAPFTREIEVVAGRETQVEARLVAERTMAPAPPPPAATASAPALVVETDVEGAQVFVDRTFVGEAPASVAELAAGSHRVNVSAPGFEMFAETFEFDGSPRTISVRFKEVRLDERVGVVHKHGFGSCKGELRATPEGILFDTDHDKDGFRVPFDRLETFEFDYIDKNLELKIKGGRRYNFRPQSGNPDDLLVFQQQAQKYRLLK